MLEDALDSFSKSPFYGLMLHGLMYVSHWNRFMFFHGKILNSLKIYRNSFNSFHFILLSNAAKQPDTIWNKCFSSLNFPMLVGEEPENIKNCWELFAWISATSLQAIQKFEEIKKIV